MAERNNKFWNQIELKLNILSSSWDEEITKVNQDFGMKETLDVNLEKEVGCALTIVGPLLDSYLKVFGKAMLNKLSRSHHTGLQKTFNIFLPWRMFYSFAKLATGYGAKVSIERRKGVITKVTVNITTEGTAAKLCHPTRLNSINKKGQKVVYNGKTTVVITAATPVSFVYNTIHERSSMSFYVQSYDASRMAIDATLQGDCIALLKINKHACTFICCCRVYLVI